MSTGALGRFDGSGVSIEWAAGWCRRWPAQIVAIRQRGLDCLRLCGTGANGTVEPPSVLMSGNTLYGCVFVGLWSTSRCQSPATGFARGHFRPGCPILVTIPFDKQVRDCLPFGGVLRCEHVMKVRFSPMIRMTCLIGERGKSGCDRGVVGGVVS